MARFTQHGIILSSLVYSTRRRKANNEIRRKQYVNQRVAETHTDVLLSY